MIRWLRTCATVMAAAIVSGCGGGGGSPSPVPPGGSPGESITGRERIGWDQTASSAADLAALRYAIYVDGTRSEIADVACATTAGAAGFACSGRLPQMSNGTHTLEIAAFRDAGGLVESSRSAPLRVTVTGSTPPVQTGRLTPGETIVASDGVRLVAERLVTGLTDPTDLALGPDEQIWTADAHGRLTRVIGGEARELLWLPETVAAGGLLSIALAPDFPVSGQVFVLTAVTAEDGRNAFRVLRYRLSEDRMVDRLVLLPDVAASAAPAGVIRVGPDHRLYAAFDAADDDDRAVRLSEWSGKILRFEPDGRTPGDQPAASPVLWSGVRVPRGLAWSDDGTLWAAEQGVDGIERLRAIELPPGHARRAGSRGSYALPRPFGGRAVAVHSGAAEPALTGDLFLAGADAGYLLRITLDREERTRAVRSERLFEGRGETIRAVAAARDGSIYFCTADALWRLRASAPLPGPGSR